jgi:hypothetical protein
MGYRSGSRGLCVKGFTPADGFYEKVFKLFSGFTTDIDMVVRPQKARLEFAIRGNPEAVAERTEFRVVERSYHFHFSPV